MSHPAGAAPVLDREPGVHLPSLPSGDHVYPMRLTASRPAPLHHNPGSAGTHGPWPQPGGGKRPLQNGERRLQSPRSRRARGMRCQSDIPTLQHPNRGNGCQPRCPINPLLAQGPALSMTLTASQRLGVSLQAPQSRLDFVGGGTKQLPALQGPNVPPGCRSQGISASSPAAGPLAARSLPAGPVLLSAPGEGPRSNPAMPGRDAARRGPRGRLLLRLPQGNSSRNTHKIFLSCPRPPICTAKAAGLF